MTTATRPRSRQCGFALLLTLLLFLVAAAAMFLGAQKTAGHLRSERVLADSRAVAAARDALVAYALAGGSGTPGALPCPDMDGDGAANNFDCQVAGPDPDVWLGRLPRSTLGIAPAESAALWYALDDDFLDLNTVVNPESESSLTIAEDPEPYAALLIIAGDPVAEQRGRPSENPSDYLEGENDITGPHSSSDTLFETCHSDGCNDRVAGITAHTLLELVQQRVVAELEYPFTQFLEEHGHLPYAQPFGGACEPPSEPEGLVPVATPDCSAGKRLDVDDFPPWLPANHWQDHIVYRADKSCAGSGTCSAGALEVETRHEIIEGLTAVVAAAGVPLAGQSRTSSASIADYLEGEENRDDDDRYRAESDSNDVLGWR